MISNLVILLLFSFGLGQLSRLSFLDSQFNLYLSDILMAVIVLITFLKYKLEPFFYGKKHFKAFLVLAVVLPLSLLINPQNFSQTENLVGLSYSLRLILYISFFYSLFYLLHKKVIKTESLKKGFYIFAGVTVLGSIFQYLFFPDLVSLLPFGWDDHLYRMVGPFLDSSLSAGLYGVFILFFVYEKKWWTVAVFFVLLLLTYSRTAYTALSFVFLIYFFQKLSIKKAGFFIILIAAAIIILPKPFGEGGNLLRTSTIQSRIVDYQQGIQIWQENPIFGVGYNRVRYVKDKFYVESDKIESSHSGASFHSTYLLMLATTGVIGFLIFMYSFYELSLTSERVRNILLFLGIASLGDNLLLHAFILPLLFILATYDHSSFS